MKFNSQLGIALILLIGIPRFYLVLQANASGDYNYTSLIFVLMWILPFVLLKREGRKLIGLVRPVKKTWILYSFLLGLLSCIPVFLLGKVLYGATQSNWFVYISNSYEGSLPHNFAEAKLIYFSIFASVSMLFSPVGEELMYRGFIHQCFYKDFGSRRASEIDSAAFALTHLAHFGILYTSTGWIFKPLAALLWVLCMFWVSRLFFVVKQQSGSIWCAVLAHAGFNLAMTYFIFFHVL